jgi:GT2 family glycosyltransferase
MTIPRTLHQIWIGPHPAPARCIDSWRQNHSAEGWTYVLWDEQRLQAEGIVAMAAEMQVMGHIRSSPSLAGKADIWRWLILLRDGGVFVDADSLCILPVGELLDAHRGRAIAAYENESRRGPGCFPSYPDIPADSALVANGFMAFPADHRVPREALAEIAAQAVKPFAARPPWRASGPGLLTRTIHRLGGPDACGMALLPSYSMYPVHCSGLAYDGHGRVYAHQLWSSTENRAASPHLSLAAAPPRDLPPSCPAVSVLICSRNTKAAHLRPCIDSLLHQVGRIQLEVVWVDDGSDALHSTILDRMLSELESRTRWTQVRRLRTDTSRGVAGALQLGLQHATHDLVARMDSDDVMALDRIQKQVAWMETHPDAVCVGSQVALFRDGEDRPFRQTFHPAVLRREEMAAYTVEHMPRWFANHPTLMYRKKAVLEAGGYDVLFEGVEDYDLLLRLLLRFHTIYNMNEILLYYRVHDSQVTARRSERRSMLQEKLAERFIRSCEEEDDWVRVE